MFYKIARIVCIWVAHLLFRMEIRGREHIPAGGGYILASNHRSNFDPIFVATGVKSQIFFMAKEELFEKNAFLKRLFLALGAFPVARGKGDTGALDWAVGVVRSGEVLGMFLEGTRSKTGELGRPKSGTAMLAHQTKADVLPCAIYFENPLHFRSRVVVHYGRMLKNAELGLGEETLTPHGMKAASHQIMQEIAALVEEVR